MVTLGTTDQNTPIELLFVIDLTVQQCMIIESRGEKISLKQE